jgi:hypothetical protein
MPTQVDKRFCLALIILLCLLTVPWLGKLVQPTAWERTAACLKTLLGR